ncbi:MAG TPA: ATP-binding protein [Syntrophales bacterium]|nr:ATP-binding protein [Syntrophales bacterium]
MDTLSGRKREIEIIRDHIQRRKSLHLYGPPGVGKSGLLDYIIARWGEIPNPPVPIYCRNSGTLREIIHCIAHSLLGMFKQLKGLDKYLEPVELEGKNDVDDENILNLSNIAYRYLRIGDFCVILDHLEKVTPRIHSCVSALLGCSSIITASRLAWELADFSSISGSLALWHVPKLKVENLCKDDAFILMQSLHDLLNINHSDIPGLFKDIYDISQGNPKMIETIFSKARDKRYVHGGKLNLNLVVIDYRIDEVRMP